MIGVWLMEEDGPGQEKRKEGQNGSREIRGHNGRQMREREMEYM